MKASLPFRYITAVKNGKHYVVFDFRDGNGKRKRKWVGTELPEKCSKKALNAKVDKIVAEFEQNWGGTISSAKTETESGAKMDYSSMELRVFFSDWLCAIKPDVARTTYQGYHRNADRFLKYMSENYPNIRLGEVNHTHVQAYLNYKLTHGVRGSSAKNYYLAIHAAFAYAVRMEMLSAHPMDKLRVPRTEKREATFYNKDELNELFKAFEGDILELIVHIAAYYGLRRSEIIGLKWDAVDFVNKTLTIQRKVVCDYENGEEKLFVETRLKTNATRRTLPLIPHIEKMLLEKKKMDEHYRKLSGKSYNTEFDGFICRDNFGKLVSPNYVSQHFSRIVKKNGLKHLRFHDLRHSCASLLVANGIPMKSIQEWLGHSNFTVTANLYSHLEYHAKIVSAETIARVLGGETDTMQESKDSRKKKSDAPFDTSESPNAM